MDSSGKVTQALIGQLESRFLCEGLCGHPRPITGILKASYKLIDFKLVQSSNHGFNTELCKISQCSVKAREL